MERLVERCAVALEARTDDLVAGAARRELARIGCTYLRSGRVNACIKPRGSSRLPGKGLRNLNGAGVPVELRPGARTDSREVVSAGGVLRRSGLRLQGTGDLPVAGLAK